MPDWGIYKAAPLYVPAYSKYTAFAAGTSNSKGAWTQLVAATPFPVRLMVLVLGESVNSYDGLVDIGIGGEGAETVYIANLPFTPQNSFQTNRLCYLPARLPAATRIAIRAQVTKATATSIPVSLYLVSMAWPGEEPLMPLATYGAATADSGGTSIDPGGSANTKGAWVALIASTTTKIHGLMIGLGNQNNGARTGCGFLIDVGVGAEGSEVVLIPDYPARGAGIPNQVLPAWSPVLPCSIPPGTRVAVRAQCSITDATDRLFDVILLAWS